MQFSGLGLGPFLIFRKANGCFIFLFAGTRFEGSDRENALSQLGLTKAWLKDWFQFQRVSRHLRPFSSLHDPNPQFRDSVSVASSVKWE